MKKLLLIASLTLTGAGIVKAQQDPQFTQFFNNRLHYNPAYAGSEEKICATFVYRNQWTGFGNSTLGVSPQNIVGNIHAPIAGRFGVGVNIANDQIGFEQILTPTLSMAYHHKLQNGHTFSGGLGLGFIQKSLAGSKLKPLDNTDAKIPNSDVSGMTFDMNLGLYYQIPAISVFQNVYAGVSATHLNQGKVTYDWTGGSRESQAVMHYYFMTGASYQLGNPNLAIEPNILVKSDLTKTSADFNAMLAFQNKYRGGLTYRTGDAFAILAGMTIFDKGNMALNAGYSYDITTSKILDYSSGSHEIFVRYCFTIKTSEPPPKIPIPRLTPRFL